MGSDSCCLSCLEETLLFSAGGGAALPLGFRLTELPMGAGNGMLYLLCCRAGTEGQWKRNQPISF